MIWSSKDIVNDVLLGGLQTRVLYTIWKIICTQSPIDSLHRIFEMTTEKEL